TLAVRPLAFITHFFSSAPAHLPDLHSFPTRRSSDLPPRHRHRPDASRRSPCAIYWRPRCARRGFRHRSCGARRSSDHALPNERRSEEHTSELQSPCNLVCRLLLEKKKKKIKMQIRPT